MSFYDEALDYELVPSSDGPCPVCGAAGGNCKGDPDSPDTIRVIPKVPNDDPFATFIVPERIYETVTEGSKTSRKLVYAKGARIRPEEAKRLGLIP